MFEDFDCPDNHRCMKGHKRGYNNDSDSEWYNNQGQWGVCLKTCDNGQGDCTNSTTCTNSGDGPVCMQRCVADYGAASTKRQESRCCVQASTKPILQGLSGWPGLWLLCIKHEYCSPRPHRHHGEHETHSKITTGTFPDPDDVVMNTVLFRSNALSGTSRPAPRQATTEILPRPQRQTERASAVTTGSTALSTRRRGRRPERIQKTVRCIACRLGATKPPVNMWLGTDYDGQQSEDTLVCPQGYALTALLNDEKAEIPENPHVLCRRLLDPDSTERILPQETDTQKNRWRGVDGAGPGQHYGYRATGVTLSWEEEVYGIGLNVSRKAKTDRTIDKIVEDEVDAAPHPFRLRQQ